MVLKIKIFVSFIITFINQNRQQKSTHRLSISRRVRHYPLKFAAFSSQTPHSAKNL